MMVASDTALLDLLRKCETMTVAELAGAMGVTATAVRQRLNRLLGQGYIERSATSEGRGRPSHHYGLTLMGRRKTGSNFADLAIALWQEIRAIEDIEVRRGLLQRVAKRMVAMYHDQLDGNSVEEKMASLVELFADRQVPVSVDVVDELPVLTVMACPYPELAEQDRSICSMERMMFAELVGDGLTLTQCRLDGSNCCTFECN